MNIAKNSYKYLSNFKNKNMKKFSFLLIACTSIFTANAQWKLTGNAGTTAGTNYLGTTDAKDLVLKTNGLERLRITAGTGTLKAADPVSDYVLYATKSGDGTGLYVNTTYQGSPTSIYGRSTCLGVYGYGFQGVKGYGYGYASTGVYGDGYSYGVQGIGHDGSQSIGVYGSGDLYGVKGQSISGNGVYATSASGYALYAVSTSYRGLYCQSGSGWYSAWFNGDVYATGVFTSSDARLKKNIVGVENAMDIINKLQPKHYDFRNDGVYANMNLPKGPHYGLLAQDVEKILPALVKEEKFNTNVAKVASTKKITDNMTPDEIRNAYKEAMKDANAQPDYIDVKAVNYTELIPVMIKGMQELSKQNEEKTKQIDDLQQQINTLKANNATQSKTALLNNASLSQNSPNPFAGATSISYKLPSTYTKAEIIITNTSGNVIKRTDVSGSGNGIIAINASLLTPGTYKYSLYVNGIVTETKQMIVQK